MFMKYSNYNLDISFKRINCEIEPNISISCYGYEDFAKRKSFKRMHKMNEYTLQFVEFGQGILNIDGNIYALNEGDLFFLPYNVPLMYYHNPSNPYKYYWISIRGENFSKLLAKTRLSTNTPVIHFSDSSKILEAFKSLDPLKNISTIKIKAVFYSILSAIENENPSDKTSDAQTLFNQILEYIDLNFSQQNLSIESIAEQFHINTVSLYRLFMTHGKCSAKEYLISYRIEKAKQLLNNGVSINKTSESCGYTDIYYFSRAFKKQTGETPSQYKKRTSSKS